MVAAPSRGLYSADNNCHGERSVTRVNMPFARIIRACFSPPGSLLQLHYVVSYFTLNGRGESQQQQQPVIAMSNANATSNATSDVATNGTVASNGAVATIDDAVENGYTWVTNPKPSPKPITL